MRTPASTEDREAAPVGVACHASGVMRIQVAACNEGAQDAFAHTGLHPGDGGLIDACGCVKSDTV